MSGRFYSTYKFHNNMDTPIKSVSIKEVLSNH